MIKEYKVDEAHYLSSFQTGAIKKNQVFNKFAGENSEDFYNYLDSLGLAEIPDLIVLPQVHHYYYEAEDLKNLKILVNLKQLNSIRNLMNFLYVIYHILPPSSYFAGSFSVNNKQNVSKSPSPQFQNASVPFDQKGKGFESEMPLLAWMHRLIDFGGRRNLTKSSVTFLLEEAFFKVLDMTEINGRTYFCARKNNS